MTGILLGFALIGGISAAETVVFDRFSEDGCSFTVSVGEPAFREYEGGWFPVIDGMGLSMKPGGYVLPSLTVHVPVPPGVRLETRVEAGGHRRVEFPGTPLVAPVQAGSGLETVWKVPPAGRAPFPSDPIEVETFRMAGTTIAAVTVHPFAGGAAAGVPSRIRVSLSWPSTGGSRSPDSKLLSALLLDDLPYWPVRNRSAVSSPFWGSPWARIEVSSSGVYVVTGEELQEAGCEIIGTPSATLRMFAGPGRQFDLDDPADEHSLLEVPVEVSDGGDGIFGTSDTLKFFALGLERFDIADGQIQRLAHRYADSNVYWLSWGGENGSRVDTLEALPDGSPYWGDSIPFHIWQEQRYFWLGGQEERTGWVWSRLFSNMPAYFYFSTPSVDGGGTLTVSVVPETLSSGPHRLVFDLNGTVIADTAFIGYNEIILQMDHLEFSTSMNQLKVTAVDQTGSLYFNFLCAEYPRRLSYAANRMLRFAGAVPGRYSFLLGGAASSSALLDLTDPLAPVRLRGELAGEVLDVSLEISGNTQLWLDSPEGYRSPALIAPAEPGRIIGGGIEGDVAVVVAEGLMEAAAPLEAVYAARGLSAAIVSAGEVYDEFGQGVRDPGAIRSFFRYTQDRWNSPAEALLLVGDGTYDPMMYVSSAPTLIPVFLLLSSRAGTNTDDGYVTAHENGVYPEVPVSRIPASNPSELAAYLSKVMAYDSDTAPGEWQNRVIVAADDEWGNNSVNEYIHTESCELLADSILPPSLERHKFYLIEYPWPPGTSPSGVHPEKPEARQDFIEVLSEGAASMIFFGHGSYGQLAHEKLLVSTDVNLVNNGPRQPLMIFASCDLAHFDMTAAKCLSEDFTLKPSGGSIAAIGSTRGSFSVSNEMLFSEFYGFLYGADGISTGDALWLAKVQVPEVYFNSRFYVYLGDGGLHPPFPSSEGCGIEVHGDTLLRGRVNTLTGSFRNSSTGFLSVTESGTFTTYSGLGSGSVTYLRYGAPVYRGLVTGQGTGFSASFFMPLQADTGSYSRAASLGVAPAGSESAWNEWLPSCDMGGYATDTIPPEIEMWIQGHRGDDMPAVGSSPVLRAVISDSSGICAMGGGAGRSILLSLDGQGFDVSGQFSYRPGSYTTGDLEYGLPVMTEGDHRLILAAWDGMGNTGRDTLDFRVVQVSGELLSSVFVYPNPGRGPRSFNFLTSTPGTATITVYTVAGRAIWRHTSDCPQGYNQVMWNGLDMERDEPASGPYIYRIDFESQDGGSAAVTEVLAVIRSGG